ncbi:MAG: ABC transporter substrate-binding protein [Bacteroidales bacterium]|nr:ABC transporter substrate-binding protein [Bacteroidales bacterium]
MPHFKKHTTSTTHRLKTLCLAAILTLTPSACHTPHPTDNQTTHTTYQYTDDYGSIVNVPTHPHRIVSLSPAVTEIIFALGADSLLVGRTDFCNYPPQAQHIESIGGISNLNIEKVLSCKPDLIISGSMVPQKIVQQFAKMNIPLVCVIEKQKFDGLFTNVHSIGRLIGKEHTADSLNASMRKHLKTLVNPDTIQPHPTHPTTNTLTHSHTNTLTHSTPSVYYVVGFGPDGNFTAGGNTFINDIIQMAGGHNIAAESQGWTFSLEALINADPDFILIRANDSARFCNTPPYNQLSAVKNNRTIALEDGILDLQVPRNIDVIKQLRNRFATK